MIFNLTLPTHCLSLVLNDKYPSFHFQIKTQFQTIKSPNKLKCSASKQPQKQQNEPRQSDNSSTNDKRVDPVGFLTRLGITHKAFSQFLRERSLISNILAFFLRFLIASMIFVYFRVIGS